MAGYRRKVIKALKDAGYEKIREPSGSHTIYGDGVREVSVPYKLTKRHTANGILKEAGIGKVL